MEDGPNTITDANAILVYLASKYDPRRQWLPLDADIAAEVQRYLSLTAGKILYKPATNINNPDSSNTIYDILNLLESRLEKHDWLSTKHATIADLANYAPIANAPKKGITLNNYPFVRTWIKRIEHLPKFLPLQPIKANHPDAPTGQQSS